MNIQEWIAMVDERRARGGHLAMGEWRGYLNDGSPLLRGNLVLARWRTPSVVVAGDDPETVFELAKAMERAIELDFDQHGRARVERRRQSGALADKCPPAT